MRSSILLRAQQRQSEQSMPMISEEKKQKLENFLSPYFVFILYCHLPEQCPCRRQADRWDGPSGTSSTCPRNPGKILIRFHNKCKNKLPVLEKKVRKFNKFIVILHPCRCSERQDSVLTSEQCSSGNPETPEPLKLWLFNVPKKLWKMKGILKFEDEYYLQQEVGMLYSVSVLPTPSSVLEEKSCWKYWKVWLKV